MTSQVAQRAGAHGTYLVCPSNRQGVNSPSFSNIDFLKVLSNNFPWPVGFAVGKDDLSRLMSLALTLATSSLEITFSLRSRVINKERSTCASLFQTVYMQSSSNEGVKNRKSQVTLHNAKIQPVFDHLTLCTF